MDRKKGFGLALLLLGIMLVIFPACASSQSVDTAAGQTPAGIGNDHDHDHEQVPETAPVTISEKGHDHSAHQDPAWWIPVFGIITITLLFLTTIIGWNIRRKPAFFMLWHKRCAVLTCLSALIHMTLVILYH